MVNREWYDKEETYNGKSDILRYEILYQNGGIYIDADSFIVKFDQFDKLISDFDADAGFGFEVNNKLACGGVSLAKKDSKFMKLCIDEIPKRDFNLLAWQSIGPRLITEMLIRNKDIPITLYKSTVFYPIRWHGIQDIKMHEKMELPPESVMFQYGYSTNNLESKI
jgi:mannosyltransferase OCH1-like enzyme